jgi:Photosynthetic reaction centre cytochrome C subunit
MTCVFRFCSLMAASVALIAAAPMHAQGASPPGAPGGQPRAPRPAPTNLKVLPKTTSGDDVLKLMRQFTGDLGVQCAFCHAEDATTHRLNPASDANTVKEAARFMIAMTDDLNKKYLDEMPDRRYADPITCGTCHRGQSHPSVFVPAPPPPRPAGAPPAGGAGMPPVGPPAP